MLVLPYLCGGNPPKKTSEGTFLHFGVAKLKHTQLAFSKRMILCLLRKRAENTSKNKAIFFVVGYRGWSPFPSTTFWEISVSSWKCKFLRWIKMNISVCQKYIWRKIAYHHLVKCVDVSPCWNRIRWINKCVTLLILLNSFCPWRSAAQISIF